MRKWARRLLMVTLAVSAITSVSCHRTRYIYRPSDEQVFLVPPGAVVTSSNDTPIITDDQTGRRQLDRVVLPYPAVILSEGYFMKLYRERVEGLK